MSGKKKKAKRKLSKAKPLKIQEDLVDFDSWFWFQTQNKRLRDTQKIEIKIFFTEKGLKNREPKSKYEETLKLY